MIIRELFELIWKLMMHELLVTEILLTKGIKYSLSTT
jgi:hypothetical protein